MTWFDADPTLLTTELDALNNSGYKYCIDEVARKSGNLVIEVDYGIDGQTHKFICIYPFSYPYFAVRVKCSTFPPGRHLNPYDHFLCLLEDEQSEWNPNSDSLATMLDEQVPNILKAHSAPHEAADIEGNVGYQISGQIPCDPASVIFVNDIPLPASQASGRLMLGVEKYSELKTTVRGFVESLNSKNKTWQAPASPLEEIYPKKLPAKWVKLDSPPKALGNRVLEEACEISPEIQTPNFWKHGIDIVALIFPEESEYKTKVFNWIFVVRRRYKNHRGQFTISIVRCDRFTRENVLQRVPRLQCLEKKTILILGLGALGSHIAWQLARGGAKLLTLIDYDVVQVGNMPRWMIGFKSVGYPKIEVLNAFLTQNFPGIQCKLVLLRIGGTPDNTPFDEHERLMDLIDKSDIVIDAIAETNVSLFISHLCQVMKTSYVWATGTQGAWGGIVGRVIPGVTEGTWKDFSHHYARGKIKAPPAEEGSDIQPVGCFDKTFTGTGFDMDHVSLMATRLVVATLARGEAGGYPDFDWDVGVLHLWDEKAGLPIAPRWETHKLTVSNSSN